MKMKKLLLIITCIAQCGLYTKAATTQIKTPSPAIDESKFGEKISRTMKALATSTPEKRNKVRLLFYGQSIIGQSWTAKIGKRLKEKYPNADFTYENLSIGGFTSERLVKTAKQDLYPYYADLVIFHDYIPLKGTKDDWEEMIAKLRKYTTAEILVTTHHYSHQGNAWLQKEYDRQSQIIRDIATKYDCELVEVRKEWKQYMNENNLKTNDLLTDIVHLNQKGCDLMEALVWRHLRYNPNFPTPHDKWIKYIPVTPDKDGSLKVEFEGNRVDIIAGTPVPRMGTAKILIDGKPASANPKAYTTTRTTKALKAWWPAITTISSNHPMPQAEDWELTVKEISKEREFKYDVTGSITGFDGSGSSDTKFTSNSGRVVIDPENFQIKAAESMMKEKMQPGFKIKWAVSPMFKDTYTPPKHIDKTKETATTITQLIENKTHTLEIIPNEDGPVPIKGIKVYQPALKQ